MSCENNNKTCGCQFNVKSFGECNVSKITFNGNDRTLLNWSETSVPEVLCIPEQKPDMEHLNQVFVVANLKSARLIETPFSYKIYQRAATVYEITAAIDAITAATVNVTPITAAITAITGITGLPVIPAVAALTAAGDLVTSAAGILNATITSTLTILNAALAAGGCISALALSELVQEVIDLVVALQTALTSLTTAGNALVTATTAIPVVGGLVATAVATLNAAITTVSDILEIAIDLLRAVITLLGNTSVLVLNTNEEGTCLSGRKIIVEGTLDQKVVYTALVPEQRVHSFEKSIPFTTYINAYAKFVGLNYVRDVEVLVNPDSPTAPCESITVSGFPYTPGTDLNVDLCEDFNVEVCIEDIFAYQLSERDVFKNTTLFLYAKPISQCL